MTQHILADLRAALIKFKKAINVDAVEVPDYVIQESIYLAMDSMIFDVNEYNPDFARFHNFHRDHLSPNPSYAQVFSKAFDEFVNDVRGYMQGHGLYDGNGFAYIPSLLRASSMVMQPIDPPQYFTESCANGN